MTLSESTITEETRTAPESLFAAAEALEEVGEGLRRFPGYPAYKPSDNPWVGTIPAHWDERRLKLIADVRNSNVDKKTVDGEEPVRLCNYVDVYYNDYITEDLPFMAASAPPEQIRRFRLRRGDVIITKDSEAWDDIAVPACVDGDFDDVVCGYHLALIRPTPNVVDGDYLFRAFMSHPVRDQFRVRANGVTRFGLPRDGITGALFPVPPLDEQRAIAMFLRRETAKIDGLVAKKRRLIELLREKRTALISHAVTKGLNPDAPMKPSGIDWLGDVPEHWQVKRLKRDGPVMRGASPRPIDSPEWFDEEGEWAWVRIEDVTASTDGILRATTQRLSRAGEGRSKKLQPGSLFLSMAGSVGKPCVTSIKCCVHDGFVYFPFLRGDSRYYYYLFFVSGVFGGLGKLGTQLNLNTQSVGDIYAPSPPAEEQAAIATFIDLEGRALDGLVAQIIRATDRLVEYRSALISAAVTGKIDVRMGHGARG